ncbi:MAG: CPBP family intramembrane metalloprotease [Anaerolineae bacterium]|nr:CPBP family intramembrane metalloprotease [Anaerolineae bacterium]
MQTTQRVSLREDWKSAALLVYATLAIVLDFYKDYLGSKEKDSLLFYLVIPLLLLWVFRRSPAHYGFRLGNWKLGLLLTVGGCLLMAPIIWFIAQRPDFQRYYTRFWSDHGFWGTLWFTAQDLIGWEFFFRGLLLILLADLMGSDWAILFQAIIFTLAHLTKPQIETLSCIVGGSAFGWIGWKTRSFCYPFLIHLFVAFFTIWAAQLP